MTRPSPLAPRFAASPTGLGGDVDDLLTCNLQAWNAYCTAWFAARSVDDRFRANAALVWETVSLAGLAAARRQSFHGVLVPTLNEA